MYNRHNLSIMSSRTKNKTVEELMATLLEDMRFSRITRADGDTTLLAILKQQQVTIEQNQKKIKEQQELIEHLCAWAEERDEAKYDGKTPSEADAEAYLNLMYPVEEEEPPKDKDGDLAPVIPWSLPSPMESPNIWSFDYRNFKLYDEYEGEKEGYTFLPKGPHGSGYYKKNY